MVHRVISSDSAKISSSHQSDRSSFSTISPGRIVSLFSKEPSPQTPTCNTTISGAKVAMISLGVIALIAAGVVSGGAVPAALAFGAILLHSAWGIAAISTIGTIALANLGLLTSLTAAARFVAYQHPTPNLATQAVDSVAKTVEKVARRFPCIIPFVLGIGLAPVKVGLNMLQWGFNEISYLRNEQNQTLDDTKLVDGPMRTSKHHDGWVLNTYSRLQDHNFLKVPNQGTFMHVISRGADAILQGLFLPTTLALAANKYLNPLITNADSSIPSDTSSKTTASNNFLYFLKFHVSNPNEANSSISKDFDASSSECRASSVGSKSWANFMETLCNDEMPKPEPLS